MPFQCSRCETVSSDPTPTCAECGGFLMYREPDPDRLREALGGDLAAALPDLSEPVRMGEGNTPLVALDDLGADLGVRLHGKLESLNPTGAFKDRGSSLTLSQAVEPVTDWQAVVVASTGNTASSVAAYAARAGVPCAVLVPREAPLTKVAQAASHGVRIVAVEGSFSDCFELSQRLSGNRILNATAVYSANPFAASANRGLAFEIAGELGGAPDWVSVPVGAGPLLAGVHAGFGELREAGLIGSAPRLLGVQARGCHPIVRGYESGRPVEAWEERITTSVDSISDPLVGYAEDGEHTRRVLEESNGEAVALPDRVMNDWKDRLARQEGVYAESASAAAVGAVERSKKVGDGESVVALITGHGLKQQPEDHPETTRVGEDLQPLRRYLLSGSDG